MGAWTELVAADGHRLAAYRAEPAAAARAGVVIIQEVFGVNGHVRALVDQYAADGYAAVAPALFDRVRKGVELGYTPEGTAEGRALRTQIGWDAPLLDIEAAAGAAGTAAASGKVGTIGFCWGGSLSFLTACRSSTVACAVAYYGAQIIQFVDERPRVPVLIHFGERDALIPAADRERIAAGHPASSMGLRPAGPGSAPYPAAEIHLYPAGHGFNCTERADYHPESAALAKERTLAFLRKHVG